MNQKTMKKAGMRLLIAAMIIAGCCCLLIAAMIIAGCCCLLYPVYTNLVFRYYSDESRKEYEEAAAQKDAAYKETELAKARIYNASLSTTSLLDPFSGDRMRRRTIRATWIRWISQR